MTTLLTIGDFSRMTHLSVKALRHYHDTGVLEPAAVDPYTGYRSYSTGQVPAAQVIRRLRDLGMPLDGIRAVLAAPDAETRNAQIAAHLGRMERQLAQVQASVSSLRALLSGPAGLTGAAFPGTARPPVQVRAIPAVSALAVTETVEAAGALDWWERTAGEIAAALADSGRPAAGCLGGLFPGDWFEAERAEITLFRPVGPGPGPGERRPGRVRLTRIPAAEAAVVVHEGTLDDIDLSYGALGVAVAERAIGVDGPIREYYQVGPADTDDEASYRTEVCWPVFRTTPLSRVGRTGLGLPTATAEGMMGPGDEARHGRPA